eukprot:CAMPEP_0172377236 /NCGR_PEP_ID=MMETSP1060-20121228/68799_1 /TAXON_ID=37318 /ORGANISM="Pseudo-nitzschia pungens, Strain cf. cingulata" /LENGTH=731 /DNA_ID=CAMNT_0013104913 /DNA_START=31 /DNA_END=2224 /DNA_ORIENTATION=+
MEQTNGESSYVVYGVLQKQHKYVDWIRVDCVPPVTENAAVGEGDQEDAVTVGGSIRENEEDYRKLDLRAFESLNNSILHDQDNNNSNSNDDGDGDGDDADETNEHAAQDDSNKNKNKNNSRRSGYCCSFHLGRPKLGKLPRSLRRLSSSMGLFPTVSPQTISYGIFDADWKPLRFSPRHTNYDVAILLYAAAEEQKRREEEKEFEDVDANADADADADDANDDYSDPASDGHWKRTRLKTQTGHGGGMFSASTSSSDANADAHDKPNVLQHVQTQIQEGKLPLVPVRRSAKKQSATKLSVKSFFRKESFQLAACVPLWNSPRTIVGFDLNSPSNSSNDNSNDNDNGNGNETTIASPKNAPGDLLYPFDRRNSNDNDNGNGNETTIASPKNRPRRSSLSVRSSKVATWFCLAGEDEDVDVDSAIVPKDSESHCHSERSSRKHQEDGSASMISKRDTTATGDKTNSGLSDSSEPEPEPAGYVALTIDDVPCRFDDRNLSRLADVLDLLDRYDARATFMVISSFLSPSHEPDMIRLLREGHELANHGVRDEAMDKMATSIEVFLEALDECNHKIEDLQRKAMNASDTNRDIDIDTNTDTNKQSPPETIGVRWFRAPHGRFTTTMEEGLARREMYNVMCSAYAACPVIEDGPWLAETLSQQIRNGSIALIHMPEKCGFREYCFEALELLLETLCNKKNFKVVTVGELEQIWKDQQNTTSMGVEMDAVTSGRPSEW